MRRSRSFADSGCRLCYDDAVGYGDKMMRRMKATSGSALPSGAERRMPGDAWPVPDACVVRCLLVEAAGVSAPANVVRPNNWQRVNQHPATASEISLADASKWPCIIDVGAYQLPRREARYHDAATGSFISGADVIPATRTRCQENTASSAASKAIA